MVVATIGYGFLLKELGDAMPFVDSFTTISSVVAMIVSVVYTWSYINRELREMEKAK